MQPVISGAGVWTPPYSISNEELVGSYNAYAEHFNSTNKLRIANGKLEAKPLSSAEFVEKASGIKSRYVYVKNGILDIDCMCPRIPERSDSALSHQAEMGLNAAQIAMQSAHKTAAEIDMVIVSCAYTQRAYPAIAIEIQHALGIQGFGFDMLVACSAATFALQRAQDAILAGSAKCVLLINPELTSPQINYRDRDSHFIFGDVSTATIVERESDATAEHVFKILGSRAVTQYSNNIRSNFSYVSRAYDSDPFAEDKLFHQQGRKVFKEVCPMAVKHLSQQVSDYNLEISNIRRWWLHQANLNMNLLINKKLVGKDLSQDKSPTVLDTYANTASAGSILAFAQHHQDLKKGDYGVICSFGAGYSIGSLLLQKQ
ncbi:MAG: beta-ketoacyl-ACP synthase III [Pseudomonadales bacterium]|nr:beta-ketoacyl-ACP synthase III [Pseudomonadales bacterium]